MNSICRVFAIGLLSAVPALACPPTCSPYHPYYVVVASGTDQRAVLETGSDMAQRLHGEFTGLKSLNAPESCGQKENCLTLIDSVHDSYWKPDGENPKAPTPMRYAVVYFVYVIYHDAGGKAGALLAKIKPIAPAAYKVPLTYCACE